MSGVAPDPLDRISISEWEAVISRALDWVPHTDEQETERTAGLLALSALTVYADALLDVARAARDRVRGGHNRDCSWVRGGPNPPPCDCGHSELAGAVRALARLDKDAA